MDKEKILVEALWDEEEQLEKWANESVQGGWSTHQVEPMRKRAVVIRDTLYQCGYGARGC